MRRAVFSLLLLAVAIIVLYAPVRAFPFIAYDDPRYVTSEHVRRGLTFDGIAWSLRTFEHANWHPLTWMSLMADAEMHGDFAGGYHLTSVLLHVANACLLYTFLSQATRRHWPAMASAGLWALHPLRVESVVWIAERKDVLCGLFFFTALLAYLHYTRRNSPLAYASLVLAFALALMSKPMAVTFPFVLLLLDFWPLDRPRRLRLLLEKSPLLAMTLASCVLTYLAQRQGGAMSDSTHLSFGLRLGNALWSIERYVRLSLWPDRLAIHYPYEGALPATSLSIAGTTIGLILLLGVTAGGLTLWRRQPALLIGWLWFVGMLIPVIGLVQVGSQAMADRYTYLPQVGLSIAIVWAVATLTDARPKLARPAILLVGALAIALAIRTRNQIGHWRDDITLFTHALSVTEHNHLAHDMLGLALSKLAHNSQAIEHYRRAVAIKPDAPNLHYNLARLYDLQGDLSRARSGFEQALALKSDYADAMLNLAHVLSQQGEREQAIAMYEKGLRQEPRSARARFYLALLLRESGRIEQAQSQLLAARRRAWEQGDARLLEEIDAQLASPPASQPEKPPPGLPIPYTNPENRSSR